MGKEKEWYTGGIKAYGDSAGEEKEQQEISKEGGNAVGWGWDPQVRAKRNAIGTKMPS